MRYILSCGLVLVIGLGGGVVVGLIIYAILALIGIYVFGVENPGDKIGSIADGLLTVCMFVGAWWAVWFGSTYMRED